MLYISDILLDTVTCNQVSLVFESHAVKLQTERGKQEVNLYVEMHKPKHFYS